MALPPALKKSMPALGNFGIWLGISTLTGFLTSNPELANALATAGVGVANLDGACDIVKGIASKRLFRIVFHGFFWTSIESSSSI